MLARQVRLSRGSPPFVQLRGRWDRMLTVGRLRSSKETIWKALIRELGADATVVLGSSVRSLEHAVHYSPVRVFFLLPPFRLILIYLD